MKVDGYKIEDPAIAEAINRLAEADGTLDYSVKAERLAEAAKLCGLAIMASYEIIIEEN